MAMLLCYKVYIYIIHFRSREALFSLHVCMQRGARCVRTSLYHHHLMYMSIDCIWLNSASFLRRRKWSSSSKHSFVYQNEMHGKKSVTRKTAKLGPRVWWGDVTSDKQHGKNDFTTLNETLPMLRSSQKKVPWVGHDVWYHCIMLESDCLRSLRLLFSLHCDCWRFFFFCFNKWQRQKSGSSDIVWSPAQPISSLKIQLQKFPGGSNVFFSIQARNMSIETVSWPSCDETKHPWGEAKIFVEWYWHMVIVTFLDEYWSLKRKWRWFGVVYFILYTSRKRIIWISLVVIE